MATISTGSAGPASPAVTAAGAVGNGILVQLNHGATETAPEMAVCDASTRGPPSIMQRMLGREDVPRYELPGRMAIA